MSIASEPKHCPKCQTPLPGDAPQGLCPKCLLAAAALPTEAGQPAPDKTPPSLAELAAAFPQLEILELIGQGGMGFVFKARQPKLDRFVALKILPQSLAADPAFAERFSREGRVLAKLNHPNIVTIHDFGQANGFFYLLMEFVDGVNLRQAMRAGRFTPDQALAIVPKICEALQFAHNEGILHRDIKPENILLDAKGRVKIADFGIAKLVGDVSERSADLRSGASLPDDPNTPGRRPALHALTEAGKALGTPNYMAPEQRECSGEVDHRADIYSLGVVFYEMLTGELPLGRFAPPSEKSAADPRVDEVVLRALEKEKAKRYASADEVKTQVETIAATPNSGRRRGDESQTEKAETAPDSSSQANQQDKSFSKWAFGLFLLGTLGVVLLALVFPSVDRSPGAAFLFGGFALLLALTLGVMGWRERLGKLTVIATGMVFVIAGVVILFILPAREKMAAKVTGQMQREEMERVRQRFEQHRLESLRIGFRFGPVIERVVEARQSGTNMFLDLDTGEILTPPPTVVEALTAGNSSHDLESYWQGLDIMANTRPAQYLAWLNESGADLIFNGKEDVLTFDGVLAVAHGTNSAAWDSWDGVTPEMTRSALDQIKKATHDASSGVTTMGYTGTPSYTSANQLYSRYGGPRVNQLTPEQSKMWFFKTREGGIGILQITGFTENPRGVKLRYKLVQNGFLNMADSLHLSEPSYQGRKLLDWLAEVDYGQPPDLRAKASEALRQMGTNIIPFLLADLGDGNPLQVKYDGQDLRSPDERLRQATWAFDALGAAGKPAIPQLEKLLAVSPGYVPSALAGIGRAALPKLLKALTNDVFWVRDNAAGAIANGIYAEKFNGLEAVAALPIALSNLTYTNETNSLYEVNTRARAADLIKAIRSDPALKALEIEQQP